MRGTRSPERVALSPGRLAAELGKALLYDEERLGFSSANATSTIRTRLPTIGSISASANPNLAGTGKVQLS